MTKLVASILVGVFALVVLNILLTGTPRDPATAFDRQLAQDTANAHATATATADAAAVTARAAQLAPFVLALVVVFVCGVVVLAGYALFLDLHTDVAQKRTFVYPRGGYLPVPAAALLRDPDPAYRNNRIRVRALTAPHTQIMHQHDQRRLIPGDGPGLPVLDLPSTTVPPTVVPTLTLLYQQGAFFGEDLLTAIKKDTGALLRIRWDQFIAPAFVGKPRNGKSSGLAFSILSFILYLANQGREAKILVYDPHFGQQDSLSARLAALAPWFLAKPGQGWRDLENFCHWINAELERRKHIEEHRGPDTPDYPGLVFVLDELSSVFIRVPGEPDADAWKRVGALLAATMYTVNTQGPKYLMTIWMGTHEVTAQALGVNGNDATVRRAISTWVMYNNDAQIAQKLLNLDRGLALDIAEQAPGEAVLVNHLAGLRGEKVVYPMVSGTELQQGLGLARETIAQRKEERKRNPSLYLVPKRESSPLDTVEWPDLLRAAATAPDGGGVEVLEGNKVREVVVVAPPPQAVLALDGDAPEASEVAEVPTSRPSPSYGERITWDEWLARIARLENEQVHGTDLDEATQEYLAFVMLRMLPKPYSASKVLEVLWSIKGGPKWDVWMRRLRDWQQTWERTGPPIPPTHETGGAAVG